MNKSYLTQSTKEKRAINSTFFASMFILTIALLLSGWNNAALAGGGEDCSSATVIPSLPYTDVDSNMTALDDYHYICGFGATGGRDLVYQFTPTSNYVADFNTCTGITDFDTKIYIYEGSCTGTPVACNEDACANPPFFSQAYVSQVNGVNLQAGNTYYIVIDAYSGTDMGSYTLNITGVAITCADPSNLVTTATTQTTADIAWVSNAGGSTYQVEYGGLGFSVGTGTRVTALDTSTTLTSLTPATIYDWYVREICGPGDTSGWVGANTFATACPPSVAPWTDGFENSATYACWEVQYVVNTQDWSIGTGSTGGSITTAADGSLNAVFTSSFAGGVSRLITPTLDLSGLTTPELTFNYGQEDWSGDQNWLAIYYQTTPAGAWTLLWSDSTNQPAWTEATATLPNKSATYRIAFEGTDNYGRGNVIDSVRVLEAPLCPIPSSLTAGNITSSGANLGWTENGTSMSWEISYGPVGFTAGMGTEMVVSSNPYSATGLMAETCYDWYVRAICGAGDTSSWSPVSTFCTPCNPFTAPYYEGFDTVSGPDLPSCWSKIESYNNQIAVTSTHDDGVPAPSPNNMVEINDNNPALLISPSFSDINTWDKQVRVQISVEDGSAGTDTLYFGVMSDPQDISTFVILDTLPPAPTNAFTEHIFLLDNSAAIGSATYIVFNHRENPASGFEMYIDDFNYEVAPTCPAPTDLDESSVTQTDATLNWVENGTAMSWEISYGAPGFTPGSANQVFASSNPFVLGSLNPATAYEWYVRSICGPGDTSSWSSAPGLFGTLCPPFSLPYEDGFEDINTIGCWSVEYVADTADWSIAIGSTGGSITSAAEGNVNARFTSSDVPNEVTKLITPEIDLSGVSSPTITFWYGQEVWFGDQNWLAVYYRISPSDPWVWVWSDSTNVPAWMDTTIAIPVTSPNLQIAFEGTDNWGRGNVVDSVAVDGMALPGPVADFTFVETGLTVDFTDASTNSPSSWAWDFGDGTGTSAMQDPSYTYGSDGTYDVTLVVSNGAGSDSITKQVTVMGVGLNNALNQNVKVYPNPTENTFNVQVLNDRVLGYSILNMLGKEVLGSDRVIQGNDVIDVSGIAPGTYLLKLNFEEGSSVRRISIQR